MALHHRIAVSQRQPGSARLQFAPEDRAFLAACLVRLPCGVLRQLRLVVRPDTVLRWHRDLVRQRHAAAAAAGRRRAGVRDQRAA